MKTKMILGARLMLGSIFVVFGLNGFFQFIPMPPLPEQAGAMMGGLAASGYFFPFLKLTEITFGVLLLLNRYTPLALTVLAPVVLNIVLFHLFLAPAGLAMPLLMLAALVFLAYAHRSHYRSVLVSQAEWS